MEQQSTTVPPFTTMDSDYDDYDDYGDYDPCEHMASDPVYFAMYGYGGFGRYDTSQHVQID